MKGAEKIVPAVLPFDQVATALAQARMLRESPRSYRVELPRDLVAFARVLRSLADIPVEFHLAFDDRAQSLILMTGGPSSAAHESMKGTDAETLIMDRSDYSPVLHNHPIHRGDVKKTPSIGDWMALVAAARVGGLRSGWIITRDGITLYRLEENVRVDDALYVDTIAHYDAIGRRLKDAGVPASDDEVPFSPEHEALVMAAEEEFTRALPGAATFIPWDDEVGVRDALGRFMDDGKRGAWSRKFAIPG